MRWPRRPAYGWFYAAQRKIPLLYAAMGRWYFMQARHPWLIAGKEERAYARRALRQL